MSTVCQACPKDLPTKQCFSSSQGRLKPNELLLADSLWALFLGLQNYSSFVNKLTIWGTYFIVAVRCPSLLMARELGTRPRNSFCCCPRRIVIQKVFLLQEPQLIYWPLLFWTKIISCSQTSYLAATFGSEGTRFSLWSSCWQRGGNHKMSERTKEFMKAIYEMEERELES